jgi:hypothetical protein
MTFTILHASEDNSIIGEGIMVGADAKVSRPATIEWPAPPEELGTDQFSVSFSVSSE